MDRIFDRLSSLIRSLMQDDDTPRSARSGDPDMDAAMEELDDFLRTGKDEEPEPGPRPAGPRTASHTAVPEDVAQAYKNLEMKPGATMEEVRASYRRLMRTYHPDKHTDNPDKQRIATEITQKLTESFVRIREFRRARK